MKFYSVLGYVAGDPLQRRHAIYQLLDRISRGSKKQADPS